MRTLRRRVLLPAVLAAACLPPVNANAQSNLGSVKVGDSGIDTVTVTMIAAGTLGKISARTMGAEGLDFANAGGGTCAVGTIYAKGSFCTVRVEFKPHLAGQRRGAVVLLDKSGNMLGTEYVQGTGDGPQAIILAGAGVRTGIPSEAADAFHYGLAVDGNGTVWQDSTGIRDWVLSNSSYTGPNSLLLPSNGDGAEIAFDGAGFIYFADPAYGVGHLVQTAPSGGHNGSGYQWQTDASCGGADFVVSVATDGAGNGYVLNGDGEGGGVSFSSGNCDLLSAGPNFYGYCLAPPGCAESSSLTVDPSGNFIASIPDITGYLTTTTTNLYKESTTGTAQIIAEIALPASPVSDGAGNIFVADGGLGGQFPKGTQSTYLALLQSDGTYKLNPVAGSHTGPLALDGNGNLFTDGGAYRFDLLNPSPVSLGKLGIGQSSSNWLITVANTGNSPLEIHSVTYPRDFPEAKGILGECAAGQTVAVGGFCTITVVFSPDAPLDGAESETLAEEIKLISNSLNGSATEQDIPVTGTETLPVPDVMLKSSSNPSLTGHALEVVATVTGVAGLPVPAGNVAFAYGDIPLGRAVLEHGKASFSTSTLSAGSHTLTALYSGDQDYAPSSDGIPQTIGKGVPKITLATSANPAVAGAAVTFTATVTGVNGGVAPTGTVTFYNGTAPIGTATLSSGKARLSTAKLAAGKPSILASYNGNALYDAAVGSPLTETIDPR